MRLFDGRGDRILTLQETADALDYDEEYVRERAESGLIPSFLVGGELMFSKSELERWILSLSGSLDA